MPSRRRSQSQSPRRSTGGGGRLASRPRAVYGQLVFDVAVVRSSASSAQSGDAASCASLVNGASTRLRLGQASGGCERGRRGPFHAGRRRRRRPSDRPRRLASEDRRRANQTSPRPEHAGPIGRERDRVGLEPASAGRLDTVRARTDRVRSGPWPMASGTVGTDRRVPCRAPVRAAPARHAVAHASAIGWIRRRVTVCPSCRSRRGPDPPGRWRSRLPRSPASTSFEAGMSFMSRRYDEGHLGRTLGGSTCAERVLEVNRRR